VKNRVYIETSIVSYLTARPSRDLIVAARQQVTRDWWEKQRRIYVCFVSEFVLPEAGRGDPGASRSRLSALANLPLLRVEEGAIELADGLVAAGLLPEIAATDALHLSMATVHEMNVLLTWNCGHLANATILGEVGRFVRIKGYELPIVCTPDQLMGDAEEQEV
jgi:predicted nucleic acid-binding protein